MVSHHHCWFLPPAMLQPIHTWEANHNVQRQFNYLSYENTFRLYKLTRISQLLLHILTYNMAIYMK